MATTNESGSTLADRLMARSKRSTRVGTRSKLFERFGLRNPYDDGAISEGSEREQLTFLSSKDYFDELRGLSASRGRLLWRISAVRERLQAGEALRTAVATKSIRAALLEPQRTFVDWSTQLDRQALELEDVLQPEERVASRAPRRQRHRASATERALRSRVAAASDTLARLQTVLTASTRRNAALQQAFDEVSSAPTRRQPAAARRVTRRLRGAARAASRAEPIQMGRSLGTRPLAVAQARESFGGPSKGLKRITRDSPIVMTLEQPEVPAPIEPEPVPVAAVRQATRRPPARRRAQADVPVATVAREVRNQSGTGRAGPPAARVSHRVTSPAHARPTERIARVMRRDEARPLTDVRRGLAATLRTPAADAAPSFTRRAATRAEAGLPDARGRVASSTAYINETAPLSLTLAAPVSEPVEAPAPAATPEATPPRVVESRRTRVFRTPSSRLRTSEAIRTETGGVDPSRTHRTQRGTTDPSATHRTDTGHTERSRTYRTVQTHRRSPAHRAARAEVVGALPPLARAVHRSVPSAGVQIARSPIARIDNVDRRSVGRVAAPVLAEKLQRPVSRVSLSGPEPTFPSRTADPDDAVSLREPSAPVSHAPSRPRPVTMPELPVDASGQRVIATSGTSRLGRAVPTVRAASRALAQERLGSRGRLLSPSSTAHLSVTSPEMALAHRVVDSAEAAPTVEPTQGAAPRRPAAVRLAPALRASTRDGVRQRVAPSGTLAAPRAVAPFRAPVETPSTAAPARTLPQPTRLTVARPLVEEARSGLAARASERAEPRALRRSVLPDTTPEAKRSHDERTHSTVGTSQPVKTDVRRVEPSRLHKTPTSRVEASFAWRTPRSFVARTVGQRTETGEFTRSEAIRTETSALERTRAVRTPSTRASRATAPDFTPVLAQPGLGAVQEFDPEGAIVRATRRSEPVRERLSDSPMRWADAKAEHRQQRSAGQTSRAMGRAVSRRMAGSTVPSPVGNEATDRATTRMLAGPSTVLAKRESVVLDGGQAIPAHSVSKRGIPGSDGMRLSAAESVAGGARAVSARPGRGRSRVEEALRAASAVSASRRDVDTVLALPSAERQLEASAGSPRYTVRLDVDDAGALLGGRALDGETLRTASLPSPAVWAEKRDERLSAPRTERSATTRTARDTGGVFVSSDERVDRPRWAPLEQTYASLAAQPESLEQRPLMRRRTWQRRAAAAELGMLGPALPDVEYSAAPQGDEDSPSWARRAVQGTSSERSEADRGRSEEPREWSPNSLMGALARTERTEDLVQVILQRGHDVASLRGQLSSEAMNMVQAIAGVSPEQAELLRSGGRVVAASESEDAPTRRSRGRHGAPQLHQLAAARDGVGANHVMKLAGKLMDLIHLAEDARHDAQDHVRMSRDSNEARAEGGMQVPGMSVEDMEMNLEALQKSIFGSVMEEFEELDSRRPDPDSSKTKWGSF